MPIKESDYYEIKIKNEIESFGGDCE